MQQASRQSANGQWAICGCAVWAWDYFRLNICLISRIFTCLLSLGSEKGMLLNQSSFSTWKWVNSTLRCIILQLRGFKNTIKLCYSAHIWLILASTTHLNFSLRWHPFPFQVLNYHENVLLGNCIFTWTHIRYEPPSSHWASTPPPQLPMHRACGWKVMVK